MAAAKGKGKGSTKRSIEDIRAELMKDKHTKDIAKTIGMPLAEYVELVLQYVKDPDKQPTFNTLPEPEVKKHGGSTVEDVKEWFQGVLDGKVKVAADREQDAFSSEKSAAGARKSKKITGADT